MTGHHDIAANEKIIAFTKKFYGFQLDGYCSMYFERRLNRFKIKHQMSRTEDLIDLILNNPDAANSFKEEFHISYTKFFREPSFFIKVLRIISKKIEQDGIAHIWHAGCAQGHEAYSLGILLDENGLLNKCKIYATDVNTNALETAYKGIVNTRDIKWGIRDYYAAGGQFHISDYFNIQGKSALLKEKILSKIKFAHHELGKSPSFQKFDIIICRNVFIYYKQQYQQELLKSLMNSIDTNGYIGLSNCESLDKFEEANRLKKIDVAFNIYQVREQ